MCIVADAIADSVSRGSVNMCENIRPRTSERRWASRTSPSFDYADYLRRAEANDERLTTMFRDFQMESSLRFLRDVHQQIDTYAGRKISNSPTPSALSGFSVSVSTTTAFVKPTHRLKACRSSSTTSVCDEL